MGSIARLCRRELPRTRCSADLPAFSGEGRRRGSWNLERRSGAPLPAERLSICCLRILIEPGQESGDPKSRLDEIEAALQDIKGRRLLHGFETSTWEFIALASRRGHDARIGFEDTLALPDGSRAEDHGQLVAAAEQGIARHLSA